MDKIEELRSIFLGKTVTLLDDEPSGAGFYGEKGMIADVERFVINPEGENDEYAKDYAVLRLNFGKYRDHNVTFEQPVWYGLNNALMTATESDNVEDVVDIGMSSSELTSFLEVLDHPVLEHWQNLREAGETELPYQEWLEEVVSEALGLKKEGPSIEDDGPGV